MQTRAISQYRVCQVQSPVQLKNPVSGGWEGAVAQTAFRTVAFLLISQLSSVSESWDPAFSPN